MVRPTRDAIQAYMNITDATEEVAFQRLEEHGGNLEEAVNAHFGEFDRNTSRTSPTLDASTAYDFVEDNHHVQSRGGRPGGLPSLISAARGFRPSLLLDPGYRRNIIKQISGFGRSSPGAVTGLPVDDYARSSPSHGSYPHDNSAEEEMIRAAIEASKKDVQEGHHDSGYSFSNDDPSEILSPEVVAQQEDEELARALSLSLETEKLEKAMRERISELRPCQVEGYDICKSDTNENGESKPGSSLVQHRLDDVRQKQRSDNSFRHEHHVRHIEESPHPKELGGIPAKELDKGLMPETALFSGTANNSSNNHLQARHLEGQCLKNMTSGWEPERSFLKEALLPLEPSSENEDALTLLVRMPDSSRHGRRFLQSDKLKHLFYFIDACGAVKTGAYKLVRPYPRQAFSRDDGALTFKELGLTNKQEALFLELV